MTPARWYRQAAKHQEAGEAGKGAGQIRTGGGADDRSSSDLGEHRGAGVTGNSKSLVLVVPVVRSEQGEGCLRSDSPVLHI